MPPLFAALVTVLAISAPIQGLIAASSSAYFTIFTVEVNSTYLAGLLDPSLVLLPQNVTQPGTRPQYSDKTLPQ